MLTAHLSTSQTLERYRCGPAGPYLDEFVEWLEKRGYRARTIRRYLLSAHRFALWRQNADVDFQANDGTALEAFGVYLHQQHGLESSSIHLAQTCIGARRFMVFLEATNRVVLSPPTSPVSTEPKLLVEFRHWMRTQRGTTEATLNNYRLTLIDLIHTLGEQPDQYEAKTLRNFILERANRWGIARAKTMVTAIRMFLRFLIATGRCAPGLDHAIPTIAQWRLAALPKYLSEEAVERVIASCDLTTSHGLRDRAVLLLLARLGLRAGDVAALKLSDLNWQAATVTVSGKSRRQNRLPLCQEVGDAILGYLDYRPVMDNDHVFLTITAPIKGLSYQAVGRIATQAIQRAGIEAPVHGSHILRYSAATQMLRRGLPLPAVGVVLRHASLETTATYAKVDFQLLQQVVRPWPEEIATC
jgi:site-specific recombinase XerD